MSTADEIAKLVDLHKQGALTDDELARAKSKVLSADLPATAVAKAGPAASTAESDEKQGMGTFAKVLLWAGGLFIAFLVFGATVGNTPEAREQQNAKGAIELCWKEQGRKSLAADSQRFIAGACEMMEDNYRKKYGRNP